MHPQQRRILQQKEHTQLSRQTFFLSNDDQFPTNNGTVLTNVTIIKAIMSPVAEAELGALFLNAKEAIYLHQVLTKMGHQQP
jgi:hypothetical protein